MVWVFLNFKKFILIHIQKWLVHHLYIKKRVGEYGPVFKFQILDKIVVFTIDPEGVKEAYITENFPKIPEVYENVGYPYNERFLGNGLITDTNMERWKHRRSLFNPGFHRQ